MTPVVSVKTGHVFEHSTIVKHLQMTGRCPVTNAEMTENDLLPLQVPPVAKAKVAAASIPQLIQQFQEEWDTVALESFALKKHVATLRQELSHSLYQYDAACRVIARLLKEKEELVDAMHELSSQLFQ